MGEVAETRSVRRQREGARGFIKDAGIWKGASETPKSPNGPTYGMDPRAGRTRQRTRSWASVFWAQATSWGKREPALRMNAWR